MTRILVKNATVQKLIDELQTLPRDAKVYIILGDGFDYNRYDKIIIDLYDNGTVTIE